MAKKFETLLTRMSPVAQPRVERLMQTVAQAHGTIAPEGGQAVDVNEALERTMERGRR